MMQRLESFRALGLGLSRTGDVTLTPFNPRWKRAFSDEAHLIYDQVRLEDLRLYHGGSTSIPGISAKPILDIFGAVESLDALDAKRGRLEEIGYEWKGEYGIEGRRYCVLYDPDKTKAFVHLHLFNTTTSK